MSADLRGSHPQLRPYMQLALDIARANGIPVTVTSVARSDEEQTALRTRFEWCVAHNLYPDDPYGQGCKYPANRVGDSAHRPWMVNGQQGALAFDSVVDEKYQAAWTLIRKWVGFRVADDAGDVIHAELPNWRAYV